MCLDTYVTTLGHMERVASDSFHAMEQPPHAPLGALVRTRREAAGLSQQALADQAGVSRETVNRLEKATGQWSPRPNKVAPILAALQITEADLTDVIDDQPFRDALVTELQHLGRESLRDYFSKKVRDGFPGSRTGGGRADLLIVAPNGTTMFVEVKGARSGAASAARMLREALPEEGWVVSVVA